MMTGYVKFLVLGGLVVFLLGENAYGQDLQGLDDITVEQFYKRVELDQGILDEDGDPIDFIFVETELDAGRYKIEVTDGPGDLYEVKGTDIFIKFRMYFGYAGYRTECILEVGRYSAIVYKLE